MHTHTRVHVQQMIVYNLRKRLNNEQTMEDNIILYYRERYNKVNSLPHSVIVVKSMRMCVYLCVHSCEKKKGLRSIKWIFYSNSFCTYYKFIIMKWKRLSPLLNYKTINGSVWINRGMEQSSKKIDVFKWIYVRFCMKQI